MTDLFICVGSACHLKGAQSVTEKLKALIVEDNLTKEVTLKASFCMGDCVQGCCLTIGDKKLRNVTPQNISQVFESEIKPMLQSHKKPAGRNGA